METLRSAFTGYQGNVLADGPKITKRVVIQELLNEYRYVQIYFHNKFFFTFRPSRFQLIALKMMRIGFV